MSARILDAYCGAEGSEVFEEKPIFKLYTDCADVPSCLLGLRSSIAVAFVFETGGVAPVICAIVLGRLAALARSHVKRDGSASHLCVNLRERTFFLVNQGRGMFFLLFSS